MKSGIFQSVQWVEIHSCCHVCFIPDVLHVKASSVSFLYYPQCLPDPLKPYDLIYTTK